MTEVLAVIARIADELPSDCIRVAAKRISAGDVAYLLSKKASKDFKMRGNPVLRIYTTDDDPGLIASGRRRYYREVPLLELGAKRYHLSNQFFPESRDAVLKWVYAHGLKKNDLIAAIEGKRVD